MAANFPRDPRNADVNWQLASTMARVGNDHCEQYFKQAGMLAKTPEWGTKIKLSRADWAAAHGKWDEAIQAYTESRDGLKEDAGPLKAYATYRLGWAFLSKAQGLQGPGPPN